MYEREGGPGVYKCAEMFLSGEIYTPENDTWVVWPQKCSSIRKAFKLADGTTCKNDNNHQWQLHNLSRKPRRHFSISILTNV